MNDQRTDEIILLVGSLCYLGVKAIEVDNDNRRIKVTITREENIPLCYGRMMFDWNIEFEYI